ncbi:unnamed protein product [Dovyalis caffra]|uniref:Uncharacterized protein n=1 Tax=Dovyalis caffra TaxID=77055 RepID=A0AAV1RPB3_9ROSI|nr:unnamed protein product [Dovyalis caffra]
MDQPMIYNNSEKITIPAVLGRAVSPLSFEEGLEVTNQGCMRARPIAILTHNHTNYVVSTTFP